MRQNSRRWGTVCVSQKKMFKNSHGCSVLGIDTIQEGKKSLWWLWHTTSHRPLQSRIPFSVGWLNLEGVREKGDEILQLKKLLEHEGENKKVREKCTYHLAQDSGTLGEDPRAWFALLLQVEAVGKLNRKKIWYWHTHALHFVMLFPADVWPTDQGIGSQHNLTHWFLPFFQVIKGICTLDKDRAWPWWHGAD